MQQWPQAMDATMQWKLIKGKQFYNPYAYALTKNNSKYYIWKVKEVISAEEYKEFMDGPLRLGLGQDAMMNICKPIEKALMNGQTP